MARGSAGLPPLYFPSPTAHGRYYKPADVGVLRRSGTPPLQRGASPLQLSRSPPARTQSPAQLHPQAAHSPAAAPRCGHVAGSPQRSPSPALGRLIMSPVRVTQQLALWPPRRPVGRVLVPPAGLASPPRLPDISPAHHGPVRGESQHAGRARRFPGTPEHLAVPVRVSEDSFSPGQLSDFDTSYRDVILGYLYLKWAIKP
ncbi:unnamed protein product [Symbiodinium natans]|uniref:Uncharacterized protein n=1 Tax=Symbiodinium natans TaxID=878477 RepID=A0A812IBD2_9DINO|nr:unnamed protein product [Symbiodinium natans]